VTKEKVLEVIGMYEDGFKRFGSAPVDFPDNRLIEAVSTSARRSVLAHCRGMIPKMRAFITEGRMDKAFRWLGFIQGCLWCTGIFCLEDLKNHSRPDKTG